MRQAGTTIGYVAIALFGAAIAGLCAALHFGLILEDPAGRPLRYAIIGIAIAAWAASQLRLPTVAERGDEPALYTSDQEDFASNELVS